MEFSVFTVDDKAAGQAKRHGAVESPDLDGLAEYVLASFGSGAPDVSAVIFADPDGNLTFAGRRQDPSSGHPAYPMMQTHRYAIAPDAKGIWETRRRPLDGHEQVLATFHSQETAVAYAEEDARGEP